MPCYAGLTRGGTEKPRLASRRPLPGERRGRCRGDQRARRLPLREKRRRRGDPRREGPDQSLGQVGGRAGAHGRASFAATRKRLRNLDRIVRERVLRGSSVVRVKIWDRSGRIVYSDEPGLIGARYPIAPDELKEFEGTQIDAEVSDLSKPENRFERDFGKLLEVYCRAADPERAAPPLRGVLPVELRLGARSADLPGVRDRRPRRADPARAHPASARLAGGPSCPARSA